MDYFERFGRVKNVALARHFKTDRFLGFATIEFESRESAAQVLQTKFHKLNKKHIKCKMKLLKSEIDLRRPKEEIQMYKKKMKNPKSQSKTPDISRTRTNPLTQQHPLTPNLGPKLKKNKTLYTPPPPLGDLQRPLDPRVQAYRRQEMKKFEKYKGDYRSDLRDIKFNTKPQFDYYFSAPDQNLISSRNFGSSRNRRKRKYSSPSKSSILHVNGGFDSNSHRVKKGNIQVSYESGVPQGMDERDEMDDWSMMMDMDPMK